MKRTLQDQLFKKYPQLFGDKDKPMTETCMCWGIECGDGWYSLIENLCERVMTYFTFCPENIPAFSQVKEKFGGLRIYVESYKSDLDGDAIEKMIDEVENESYHVCEWCGSRNNVTQTKDGWITTLCDTCMMKRNNERGI